MPSTTDTRSLQDASEEVSMLLAAAMPFVARARGEATMRAWIPRHDTRPVSEERLLAMAADAVLLSADLLLSQPGMNGTTAFDRLARSGGEVPAPAIAALRQARFRLLRLDAATPAGEVVMRDVVMHDVLSGERLRMVGAELPPLAAGTALFGRVAMLGDGVGCLPGAITPLDASAYALASGHKAAGGSGHAANTRWAEAVYRHVVRDGTMDVPGLNRPAGDLGDADDDDDGSIELFALLTAWAALEGPPDAALLERTRRCVDLPTILDAFAAAASAADAQEAALASGCERLLLVQLETVLRRERGGSGTLSLEVIARALEDAVAAEHLSPRALTLFATLHRRLAGAGARPAGDPALERLVQRIQALRAKTVAHGCTEQEALAAAEKVAELLDRHGLSLGELDYRAQPCDGIGIQTSRRRFAPIDSCIPAIAAFFDCRVWVEKAKGAALRYVFFGLRGDVAAAQYLYELVERAFETETDAFRAGQLYAAMAGERRSATQSFQVGLGRGICAKLKAIRAARAASLRTASGRDLVPVKAAMVDEEMAKLGLDLRQREAGRPRLVLSDAYAEGEAAGQRFEVTPALTRAA